ncbi:hypothetical protein [uncultured Arcticibacterium sp.]|uniref:hypothetical protein n=1 Tax=uncultured Arcticibacterium sp. TaxID=2173042 RepID=UPI0030FBD3F3
MVKIAHCTDFSENAKKALEGMLFNFWSFDIAIDILHLVEDDFEESLAKLELLKNELMTIHGTRFIFKTYIFRENQRDSLIEQLNSREYFGLLVGLDGPKRKSGIGSFLQSLYDFYLGNMTIVPLIHEIKIENKGLVALAYENIEALSTLVMVSDYMNFHFSKLTVLIKIEKNLNEKEVKAIRDILSSLLPAAKYELLIQNRVNISNSLLNLLKAENLDYCILFKDDFFDNYFYNHLKVKPAESEFSQRIARINTYKEKIKEDLNSVVRLTLRQE